VTEKGKEKRGERERRDRVPRSCSLDLYQGGEKGGKGKESPQFTPYHVKSLREGKGRKERGEKERRGNVCVVALAFDASASFPTLTGKGSGGEKKKREGGKKKGKKKGKRGKKEGGWGNSVVRVTSLCFSTL